MIFHFIGVLLCFTCMTLVWISSSWERLLRCRQTSWYFVYCSLRESRSFITWGWASSSSSMGDQAVPLPPPSEPLKRLCWSSDSNSCPVWEEDNRGNKHLREKSRFKPWKGNTVNGNNVFHSQHVKQKGKDECKCDGKFPHLSSALLQKEYRLT